MMLAKGVVTEITDDSVLIWTREIANELKIVKSLSFKDAYELKLGTWIAFSVSKNFIIEDFVEIPAVLPTEIDSNGVLKMRTCISFPSEGDYSVDLLAHSDVLGTIGIFQKFPAIESSYLYDAWVVRVPSSLSNLERVYKASWCVTSLKPLPIRKGPYTEKMANSKSYKSFLHPPSSSSSSCECVKDSERCLLTGSIKTNTDFIDAKQSAVSVLNGGAFTVDRWKTESGVLTQHHQCENDGDEKRFENFTGVMTSIFGSIGFVWSSGLGDGIIPKLKDGDASQIGSWIEFVPEQPTSLSKTRSGRPFIYAVKIYNFIAPLYPSISANNSVSVDAKVFVPWNYHLNRNNLWAEYFGSISDDSNLLIEFNSMNLLGRCIVAQIRKKKKGDCSVWVIHRVKEVLKEYQKVPSVDSVSFAADALRFMMEDPLVRIAIEKVDMTLVKQLSDPHNLESIIL